MTFIADNPRSWRPGGMSRIIYFEVRPEHLNYQHSCWVVDIPATIDMRDGDTIKVVWSEEAIEKIKSYP